MGLRFVLGRGGIGKTTYMLNEIKKNNWLSTLDNIKLKLNKGKKRISKELIR